MAAANESKESKANTTAPVEPVNKPESVQIDANAKKVADEKESNEKKVKLDAEIKALNDLIAAIQKDPKAAHAEVKDEAIIKIGADLLAKLKDDADYNKLASNEEEDKAFVEKFVAELQTALAAAKKARADLDPSRFQRFKNWVAETATAAKNFIVKHKEIFIAGLIGLAAFTLLSALALFVPAIAASLGIVMNNVGMGAGIVVLSGLLGAGLGVLGYVGAKNLYTLATDKAKKGNEGDKKDEVQPLLGSDTSSMNKGMGQAPAKPEQGHNPANDKKKAAQGHLTLGGTSQGGHILQAPRDLNAVNDNTATIGHDKGLGLNS